MDEVCLVKRRRRRVSGVENGLAGRGTYKEMIRADPGEKDRRGWARTWDRGRQITNTIYTIRDEKETQ